MVFYFTSTDNSLYAARVLGDEITSIAQELRKDKGIAEQMRIDPKKKVDEQLAAVRARIDAQRHYIQLASQVEVDFYVGT